jgi:hypothetical protein
MRRSWPFNARGAARTGLLTGGRGRGAENAARRDFRRGLRHRPLHLAPPLGDLFAQRAHGRDMPAVGEAIAVAGRRSHPWVPDIFRPQHLET